MANTYSLRHDFDNSFKYINRALKINPRYRNAYILKGSNYRLLGNSKLAISSYETAVQQDPAFYGGYLMLGALYEFEENPICIEYYTTASQLQPKIQMFYIHWPMRNNFIAMKRKYDDL